MIHASPFNPRRARVAVDYGPRNIGIARSDYFGLVQPHATIPNNGNLTDVSLHILGLAKQWSASEVVIGIPLDSNGKMHHKVRNLNGRMCLNFSTVLCSVTANTDGMHNIATVLFDERYTTKEAKLRLQSEKIKATLDAMSAACLLERYLEDAGEGSISAICYDTYPLPDDLAYFDYNIVRTHVREFHYTNYDSISRTSKDYLKLGLRNRRRQTQRSSINVDISGTVGSDSTGGSGTDGSAGISNSEPADETEMMGNKHLGENQQNSASATQQQPLTALTPPDATTESTMSEAERQLIEFEAIRSQRRKKGTLKKRR
eukprot:CAMPEP_0174995588 /NCGR_PEP_ID=MMETSP0004_2-20121128/24254_1 /TAXON_ID=420556 /ORGANISM="Ochromonas sp., Strain CCMP1393" /LENGTH=316 /DNA_ID=CAMNT_0016249911 /DNA_START=48 /DNA_END=998 /DNA_ORIENTATION=-